MTTEEVNGNGVDVDKATVKAMAGLCDLGCFKTWPRHSSSNIIDARCVITWKMIQGNVGVKCRSTVRGFKDQFQDSDAYAGAIDRSGQRFANVVAAENP